MTDDHEPQITTVDEILATPFAALELPEGAIPIHAIIVVEYVNPGADYRPEWPRLAWTRNTACPDWTSLGLLDWVTTRIRENVNQTESFHDDERDQEDEP